MFDLWGYIASELSRIAVEGDTVAAAEIFFLDVLVITGIVIAIVRKAGG